MPAEVTDQHLGLARVIAFEYANIPGASLDEIIAEAEEALAAAARAFDPAKGQFVPYASRAIRNALNSLFTRQLRYLKVHEFILDEPAPGSTSVMSAHPKHRRDPAVDVALEVRASESFCILEEVLASLPPRSRLIIERIREGKSFSEIGSELGVSKQAVHKVAQAAMQGLREKLEALGFSGVDSKGFLKSAEGNRPPG
jgi:RNA polymerase sigma factor (sigma-70 family)